MEMLWTVTEFAIQVLWMYLFYQLGKSKGRREGKNRQDAD